MEFGWLCFILINISIPGGSRTHTPEQQVLSLSCIPVSPRGYFDGKVGFEPTDSRDFPRTFHHKTSYQTFRKNWWLRNPSSVWVNLYHFSIFFWKISPISVVNLVLNRTILSFKVKKLLTTYLFPLIFLKIKKPTHKLSSQKTTRASDWIRTNVTFRFLITNQVQSTSMRRKPVAEYFF